MKNFRKRTFVFGWLRWSCVFWWVFAYVFALLFGGSLPKVSGKILLMSGLLFSGSFSLRFFADVVFFFGLFFLLRDKDQVVTGHPSHALVFLVSFLVCVPPLLSVSPVLAVRPASRRFSQGAILGPARFWDSPWTF